MVGVGGMGGASKFTVFGEVPGARMRFGRVGVVAMCRNLHCLRFGVSQIYSNLQCLRIGVFQ